MMPILVIYFLGINYYGYKIMESDKAKAENREYRVSEAHLFKTAVVGGGIGVYAGMYAFRHKTLHNYFVYGIPIISIFNLLIYLWIYKVINKQS